MKSLAVRLAKIVGIIAVAFTVVILALQLVLNSAWMRSKIDGIAASAIEKGELRYNRLHFRTFPFIVVEADSLSVTYPHALFSEYDDLGVRGPLLSEGRGEVEDTLFSAGRIGVSLNPWKLFGGRIRVKYLHLERPRVYYHAYDGTASNLDIFSKSEEPEDTVKKSSGLPWILLSDICINKDPRIVYTSQADTVHAGISFDSFSLKGGVRVKKNKLASKVRSLGMILDSMRLNGRLPSDTLAVNVDRLSLSTPKTNVLDMLLRGDALYFSPSLGSLHVPAGLEARASFKKHARHFDVGLDHLDASVAYVPLRASGRFSKFKDHSNVKLSAGIDSCSLGTVLDKYAANFTPTARDIRTDAVLNLGVNADGTLSDKEYPKVEASLDIPSGHIQYLPKRIVAMLDLGANAVLTSGGALSAEVGRCHVRSNGLKLDLDGDGRDLIGDDPAVAARLSGFAILDSLRQYMPENLDLSGSGRLNLSADVNAHLRELEDYIFRKTRISCNLTADRLALRMPSQGLSASLDGADIQLLSAASGLHVSADADSVGVVMSDSFSAGIAGMVNRADITKEMRDSVNVPVMRLSSDNRSLLVFAGDNKVQTDNALVSLEAYRRIRRGRPRVRRILDSLQRVYPGVPRDSLFARARMDRPRDEFASKDIRVALDSSLLALWRRWHPGGLISLENANIVSPSLPLRTRINSFDMALDDEDVQIASCSVDCGSSDMSLSGKVGGLRRFIRGRRPLTFNLALESGRLNLNEILVAMHSYGEEVSDSLDNAVYDPSEGEMKAIVVPKNLRGTVDVMARRVDYSNFDIRPASATLSIRDRVLQVKDVDVQTSLGQIRMDAFYSTKSREDISAGLDMHLQDMSAYDIIHTLPTVDAMMPALKSFEGTLNCDLSATTQLDTNLNVLTPSLNGLVRISGQDLNIKNAGSLRKITRLLMFKDKNIGRIEDMYVDAVVQDNKVEVYPFVLGVDRYRVALSGVQGFNGSMRYNASIIKSFLPFNFGINIYGNLDKWRFSLGRSKYRSGRVPSFSAELDTMQVNLLSVIRGIYDRGVDNAMEQMARENRRLEKAKLLNSYMGAASDELLSKEEFQQVDSLLFEMQMQEEQEEIDASLQAAADEALYALGDEHLKWLEGHPWAEAALSRAEQRKAARARRKTDATGQELSSSSGASAGKAF